MSDTLTREYEAGSSHAHPLRRFLRRCRAWIELHPKARWLYRILVGILGLAIVLVGIVLIPLPGPGWLIVFLGIAVLGTEFPAAIVHGTTMSAANVSPSWIGLEAEKL
ncbi:PGPGW domain-containing protein, partial [Clavibacter phaseoli]|uniref:PGPGW domain-containing protein n=1 Tax=Clavibacter phaseoli TaxID=1734031 RepID=UPI00217564DF